MNFIGRVGQYWSKIGKKVICIEDLDGSLRLVNRSWPSCHQRDNKRGE